MQFSIYKLLVVTTLCAAATAFGKLVGLSVLFSMLFTLVALAPTLYFIGVSALGHLLIPQRALVFVGSLLLTAGCCLASVYLGARIPTIVLVAGAGFWMVQCLLLVGLFFLWRSGYRSMDPATK